METATVSILVRVPRSHRKFDRFRGLLRRKPEYLYSFRFGGNFVYVSAAEYEQVKHLVTRARVDASRLLKCWNGGDDAA